MYSLKKKKIKDLHECHLAVQRLDENSLISKQMDKLNHSLNWKTLSILDQSKFKRNAKEVWQSDKLAINRNKPYLYAIQRRQLKKIKEETKKQPQNISSSGAYTYLSRN